MKKQSFKRIIALGIAFCLILGTVLLGFIGCSKADTSKPVVKPSQALTEQEDIYAESNDNSVSENQETVSDSNIETDVEEKNNMVDLTSNTEKSIYLADLLYENTQDNIVFSPTSLNMALGLANEGAKDSTKEVLNNYLGDAAYNDLAKKLIDRYAYKVFDAEKDRDLILAEYEKIYNEAPEGDLTFEEYKTKNGLTDEDIIQKFMQMQSETAEKSILNISNSAWLADTLNVSKDYKANIENYYNADIDTINVDEPIKSVDTINAWCDAKTNGLIKEIVIPADITPETIMVLLNTVYFKDTWLTGAWSEYHGEDNVFNNLDGSKVENILIDKDAMDYFENDKAEGFSVKYKSGLTFYGILPKEEGEFNLEDLNISSLITEKKTNDYDRIHAVIPEFKTETTNECLADGLVDLGVGEIFSNANFDGMVENGNNEHIAVSKIIQKCNIELDKEGTEAAAATAITMTKNAIVMEPKEEIVKEIHLDRPFAYMIMDDETQQIMFIGKVINLQ